MNRRKSRDVAMKLLFEMSINKEDHDTIIENFKENTDTDLSGVDFEYITRLLSGIKNNEEKIDSTIDKYLVKWKFERLPKMSLAILRIATFELLFDEDIPERVSINEAIELAKTYGDENAPSFINAVLNNLVK
ncbi:transcription antitermination factor NusB [Clostridium sp.]|uniref:transcription antitermination factor NusB n=1 Tax=Clostridium sp. TaxID=1506 RepID=UPI002FC5B167